MPWPVLSGSLGAGSKPLYVGHFRRPNAGFDAVGLGLRLPNVEKLTDSVGNFAAHRLLCRGLNPFVQADFIVTYHPLIVRTPRLLSAIVESFLRFAPLTFQTPPPS